ncbi:acyltransferase [Halobacteriovorax sp.]|uniref:acyltransferase n=1 Tax=Halobacteriovorax sp. TaxID=2020862 RepID=UPI003AF23859
MIKKLIKEILYILKLRKRPFLLDIEKTSKEDFVHTKYKGTSVEAIRGVTSANHPHTRRGKLSFGKHVSIRKTITLDLTGDIEIGDYVIFSDNVQILTHDHNIKSREIILSQDEKKNVTWSNIKIGNDVYFGTNAVIVKNVTEIPDGVIIGANSVLTKNPGPYEIWGGCPAKKIGIRE